MEMKTCYRAIIVQVTVLLIFISLEIKCMEEKEFDWKSLLNLPPSPSISSSIQHQNRNGNGNDKNEKVVQSSTSNKPYEKTLRRNQMKNESKRRKRAEKKAFIESLPEHERIKEISTLKEIKRTQYQLYKLKMGSKTRYKYLLELSKNNMATEDQLKQLAKMKEMTKLGSRKSRLRKKNNRKTI